MCVLQARGNNIGDGNLYVAGLYNPIPEIKVSYYHARIVGW